MIKQEEIIVNGNTLIKTYSDAGFRVVRDGVEYDEAIDPVNSGRTYTESPNKRMEDDDYEFGVADNNIYSGN